MATYQKAPNRFQTNFMVKGQRFVKEFPTQAEAEAWELNGRAALKVGKAWPPADEAKPLGGRDADTIGGVLRTAAKLHWAHKRDDKQHLNATTFVKWCGERMPSAEALTVENVEEFVSEHLIDERNVSGSTINRYLSSINTLTKFSKDITLDISHLWKDEGQGRIRWFSDPEEALVLQTLLLWSKPAERDLFTFLVDTGARPFTEGTHAPWKDFNNRKVTFWDTKTQRPRTVPMTTRSWDAVMRQRERGLEGPFSDLDKDGMDKLWVRVRNHLGPTFKDTVVYTARHTCCSRLVQRGADIMRVKEWMGHKNIATTMRYAHLAPQHLMDVAHLLEGGDRPLHIVGGSRVEAPTG